MDPIAVPYAVSKKLIDSARIRHDWGAMYVALKGDTKEYYVNITEFEMLFEEFAALMGCTCRCLLLGFLLPFYLCGYLLIFFPIVEYLIPYQVRMRLGMAWPEEIDQTVGSVGFEKQDGVVLMATTRSLKQIDEAVQRPGRMDRVFHQQRPTQAEREKILQIAAKETMDDEIIDFVDWRKWTEETKFPHAVLAAGRGLIAL
ncbi:hypothetical protein NL676_020482 [Syzygium grande]|nr:hypothetical protein NL676_020482 [Syzygium grande]